MAANSDRNQSVRKDVARVIGAHIMWRSRLFAAIQSGESELTPALAEQEDLCEPGQWLKSSAPPSVRASPRYGNCLDLHRRFHRAASKVLALALNGKRRDALNAIESGGELIRASAALVKELTMLSEELSAQH